jgi:SOS response regulatory protein OraA/RecX
LPIAERGLREAGVDAEEVSALLGLLANRLERHQTGAVWQRRALARFEEGQPRAEALRALVERYLVLSGSGMPVHAWPVD